MTHRSGGASGGPVAARAAGLTLVEILVVVAIIAVLLSVIGLVGSGIRERGKTDLTRQYMDILTTAMDEYRSAFGRWPVPANNPTLTADSPPAGPDDVPYEPSLNHPSTEEDYYLGGSEARFVTPPEANPANVPAHTITSIEGLYVQLRTCRQTDVRTILARLPQKALARRAEHPAGFAVRPGPQIGDLTPFTGEFVDPMQVLDGWGRALRWRYYVYRNNDRPFLWSAGPDGKFARDPNQPEDDPNGRDDIFSDRKD